MIDATKLREKVTFIVQDTKTLEWNEVAAVFAYISGMKNSEYWVNYIGGNAEEVLNVSVRYKKCLAELVPQVSGMIHNGIRYDIISPPDDVLFRHNEIKFRVRRQIS